MAQRRLAYLLILVILAGRCTMVHPPQGSSCRTLDGWDYRSWKKVMTRFVVDGQTDYRGIQAQHDDLDRFVHQLGCFGPRSTPEMFPDRRSRLAYWINAYNAVAMLAAVRTYPVKTVKPLFRDFRPTVRCHVDGRVMTLAELAASARDQADHDLLVELALVNPAKGSGTLLGTVFLPGKIDDQLAELFHRALNDRAIVKIDAENWTLWLAEPLYRHRQEYVEQYRRAVVTDSGTIINALAMTADAAMRRKLNTALGYRVRLLPYDWSLNERIRYKCSLD